MIRVSLVKNDENDTEKSREGVEKNQKWILRKKILQQLQLTFRNK